MFGNLIWQLKLYFGLCQCRRNITINQKETNMSFNIASLRALAAEAGHDITSEVTKFIDYIEGKESALANAKTELVAAGYTVTDPVPPV